LGVPRCDEGTVRGGDRCSGGGAACGLGDCVGGASSSVEAVERDEANEAEEAKAP